jgi:O-antigen/teichoic acid export membrane protein
MIKLFFGVAASNFAGAGFGFLLTVFLARVLDVPSFGKANFIFSVISILAGFADFGFSSSLVVFYNRFRADSPNDPLLTVNAVYAKYLLFVSFIAIPLLSVLGRFYALSHWETAVIYFSFLLFSLYRYMASVHQATGNWKRFNILIVANSIVKFLSVTLLVLAAGTFFPLQSRFGGLMAGYLCYSLIIFVFAVLLTWRKIQFTFTTDAMQAGQFYKILLPLGTAALLVTICMRFDSMLIQKYLGPHDLGIYSAANTLAFAFPLITGSLMSVLLREMAHDPSQLTRILAAQRKFLPYGLALLVITCASAGIVVPMLFGARYVESVGIFRILLIPYLGGVFFTPLESYYYAKEPMTILGLKLWQTIVVAVGSLTMISSLHLYGVALAILLSRVTGWIFIYGRSTRAAATGPLPQ